MYKLAPRSLIQRYSKIILVSKPQQNLFLLIFWPKNFKYNLNFIPKLANLTFNLKLILDSYISTKFFDIEFILKGYEDNF